MTTTTKIVFSKSTTLEGHLLCRSPGRLTINTVHPRAIVCWEAHYGPKAEVHDGTPKQGGRRQ
jgi:hypothetical protein